MNGKTTNNKPSKSRIIFLLRYLFENTDDNHAVSTSELIKILEENGFSANRKTVRDDVEMLCDAGYEIIVDKDGKSNSFHFGSRTFELPELKMLVDGGSTLKRLDYDSEAKRYILQPENRERDYPPIVGSDISVQGVAIQIIKSI